jgi:arylsulfatase A-like enzyme
LRGVKADELARYAAPPRPKNPNLSQFAPACLVAKRLVAAGVPFVEVVLGGWDTHGYVAESVEELLRAVDPAMSALIDDLERERLLESTLVAWMGEFGRTPWLNAAKGRDHYPKAFTAVLAGGGAARGRVVGATDAEGVEIVRDPVTVPELFATIVHLVGVDPEARYASREQGVTRVAEARPVKGILA